MKQQQINKKKKISTAPKKTQKQNKNKKQTHN